MLDITAGFTEVPDKTRRIEAPENPERQPQRIPERKREFDEPQPDRERKPAKVPEREPVPA
jgi:hypothetical protein